MTDTEKLKDLSKSISPKNRLRKRNPVHTKSNQSVQKETHQARTINISEEEWTKIRHNICLLLFLILGFLIAWYFFGDRGASRSTITVNYNENYSSSIYSMCIFSDNHLITADQANRSVKVVDTHLQRLITTFYTESEPWSITKVTDVQVAVSLPDSEKIQLLYVNKGSESNTELLTVERNITVNGKPIGIQFWDEKLFVVIANSDTEPGIYILDMDGNTLRSFTRNSNGNSLFLFPVFIVLNPVNKNMYISDIGSNSVTSLTFDGKVKAIYKDDDILQMPGLAMDHAGRVYLCRQPSVDVFEHNAHSIYRLSTDLTLGTVLLDETDGINFPTSLAYDGKKKTLYVGSNISNKIQVFLVV